MNGTLNNDDRAQSTSRMVNVIVGLAVAGLLAAVMLPIGIGALTDDSVTAATNQSVDETVVVAGDLNATVTSLDDTAGTASVQVEDTSSGSTDSVTVDEGSNETATVDGSDVVVAADNVGTSSADMSYSYSTGTGWGGGASALWGIMDIMIVLGAFLLFVGLAFGATNRI